jgi:hypothetical protein
MAGFWNNVRQVWANTEWSWIVLWLGLTLLIVALVVLMRTRWGQSRPLGKCAVLSLVAHLLLAFYATTVQIVSESAGRSSNAAVHAILVDADQWLEEATDSARDVAVDSGNANEWLLGIEPEPVAPDVARPAPSDADPSEVQSIPPLQAPNLLPPVAAATNDRGDVSQAPAPQPPEPIDAPRLPAANTTEGIESTVAMPARMPVTDDTPQDVQSSETDAANIGIAALPPNLLSVRSVTGGSAEDGRDVPLAANPAPAPEESTRQFAVGDSTPGLPESLLVPVSAMNSRARPVPFIYSDRSAENREAAALSRGGSPEAEAAVQAALEWLASSQSADGRWDADRFGAGQERRVLGQDRQGTGARADTAMTGLALLAFLGSGNTHLQGKYKEQVKRGLEHLLNAQASDGNLGGDAELFAFMYSHGIATLALSEAYAMTADKRLETALRAAIDYSISAQHPSTGGWRYRPANKAPQDPGDTSQLGWQLMAIKSAELAGIPIPERTRLGMRRFLASVSSGEHGGLAAYRPSEQATRPMTAEALVARQFLGMARENPAANEAGDYLLGKLPDQEQINLYYWYYGTLGMYQLQGDYWTRWNAALQKTLIPRQVKSGDLAGSWDPDCLWAGYGGRVYSTAMATLCLEVFYRYLPLYGDRDAHVEQARLPGK